MGKRPPYSKDAEEAVLGACIENVKAFEDAAEVVRDSDFFDPLHRKAFTAIRGLYDTSEPIDAVTIKNALVSKGIEASKAALAVSGWVYSYPSASRAKEYAQIVRDKSMLRSLIKAGQTALDMAYDPGDRGAKDVANIIESTIFNVVNSHTDQSEVEVIEDVFERVEQEISDAADGIFHGVPTGFNDLDSQMSGGLHPGELITVGARTSVGKSLFIGDVATNAAVQGFPVLMFSLEMRKEEIIKRWIAKYGNIAATDLRDGFKEDSVKWRSVRKARKVLESIPLHLDDTPSLTITDIRSKARRLARSHDLSLVVVDYLQLLTSATQAHNREAEVASLSRGLKLLARELEVPVLIAAQVNRESEHAKDKRPRIHNLRESGAIENDSDVIALLHRPDMYDPDDKPNTVEVIIGKQRNGPTTSVELTFLKDFTTFQNQAWRYDAEE